VNIRECLKEMVPYTQGKYKAGAIKLASNENPLGISPKAREAIGLALSNVSLYPDGACTGLKSALGKKYSLLSSNFSVGNGSDEIILLIAAAYIEAGDNAITSETTFSEYAFATKLFGGSIRYAPMRNGLFPLDQIASMVDNKTKIIFLCNPNNPTGTYFSETKLVEFIKKVPTDVLIVVDEAYIEYADASDIPDSIKLLKQFQNVVILRTFSKIYGLAGVRVGYGIGNPAIILDLEKARAPFNVNSLSQVAAVAALDDNDFVKLSRNINSEGKIYLYASFERLALKYYPTQSNFILIYINQDCTAAFEKLMSLGVTIRPLKSFGLNDAIRVTVGTAEQNEFFIRCLEKII
jgi:histidinol-phosphate aminotransferase